MVRFSLVLLATACAPAAFDPPAQAAPASATCGKTHARVGATAKLKNKFHGIGGTVTVLDDCRAEIRDFTYDGTGLDVRIYGAKGSQFGRGFAISKDLVRSRPYKGETIALRLPEGRTWDDVDSFSVWCVDVGVDFGSGAFDK